MPSASTPAAAVVPRHELESRWATVDGLRVHARVAEGAAQTDRLPLVLVHGLGVSSRYMVPTAARLAAWCPVYAPDLPGFGRSEKPPRPLGIDALADVLAAWMDEVGLERAAFLGNSFGCQVIVSFAVRHPERISCAVLGGPSVDPMERNVVQQMGRLLADVVHEPAGLLPIVFYDYFTAGLRRVWRTFHYLLGDPIEDKLPHVDVPVLVVRGEYDPVVPQEWVERAVRLLPNGRLAVIPGAGHAVNFNAPDALAGLTRRFLEAASRTG